jgi:hypothetical protein
LVPALLSLAVYYVGMRALWPGNVQVATPEDARRILGLLQLTMPPGLLASGTFSSSLPSASIGSSSKVSAQAGSWGVSEDTNLLMRRCC